MKMKKTLGLLVILSVVLGLTGCSTPITPEVELPIQSEIEESTQDEIEESTQDETEDSPQNKVEKTYIDWIVTNDESRAAVSLDSVTFETYKVPIRNRKYVFEEREDSGVKYLNRGGKLPVLSKKDYNYEFVTQVRCIEFDYSFVFDSEKDDINLFDYEGSTGLEIVEYYGRQEEDGWTMENGIVHYRDKKEGCTIKYLFLNKNLEAMARFYDEHKDGGRIVWDNN